MTLAVEERASASTAYWVLRGVMRSRTGPDVPIAWSTMPLAGPTGPVEARLQEPPSTFELGIPTEIGAQPPRVAVSIVVSNQDGALDPFLTGGETAATEYTGPSLYSLEARLYQGFAGTDGTLYEYAWTPTLVLSGGFEMTNGAVSFQLASRDERLFGRSQRIRTVGEIREGTLVPGTFNESNPQGGGEFERWADITSGWEESLDVPVPWAYGRALIPLIRASADGTLPQRWILCCGSERPSQFPILELYGERDGEIHRFADLENTIWEAQVDVERDDGTSDRIWVYGLDVLFAWDPDDGPYDRMWVVPDSATLLGREGGTMTAPDILRAIVEDHSEAGAAGIDAASFDRASQVLAYTSGIMGGIYGGDGGTIGELIPYICQPAGMALYLGPTDRLHIALPGTWSASEAAQARGALRSLHHGDVLGADDAGGSSTWEERGPGDPEDYGAPITWLSVEYAPDQMRIFPPDQRPVSPSAQRMSGAKRVNLSTEIELRWSGAWVHPPDVMRLLDGLASARTFASRQVSCITHTWIARMGIGSLIRAYHGHGLGYDGRLLRLLRAEIMPGEHVARCTWEDMGPLEAMRIGVLDSEEPWVLYRPEGDQPIFFAAGSDVVQLTVPAATPAWVGASLWTHGCSEPQMRRSWRILDVLSDTEVRVDAVAPVDLWIDAGEGSGPLPHQRGWIVMTNRTRSGWSFRADRITVCDEELQVFTDGSAGFQFSPGAGL